MRGSGLQRLFWAASLVLSLGRAHAAIEWLPDSLHEVYRPQGDFYAETNRAGRNSLWTYALWEICGRIRQAPAAAPVSSSARRPQ